MVFPIVGGNQDGTYQISNSLMFAEPDHAHLEKTYSGSSTSDRICTMSFWYKPGKNPISEASTIFSAIKSGSSEDTIEFLGEVKKIMERSEKFPIKAKYGKNYHEMFDFTEKLNEF